MPSRYQAITWTNGNLVYWRIYASLDLDSFEAATYLANRLFPTLNRKRSHGNNFVVTNCTGDCHHTSNPRCREWRQNYQNYHENHSNPVKFAYWYTPSIMPFLNRICKRHASSFRENCFAVDRDLGLFISVISCHVGTISINERGRYICNVFSHWLITFSNVPRR